MKAKSNKKNATKITVQANGFHEAVRACVALELDDFAKEAAAECLAALIDWADTLTMRAAICTAATSVEKIQKSGFLPKGKKLIVGKDFRLLLEDKTPEDAEQPAEPEQEPETEQEQNPESEQERCGNAAPTEPTEQPENAKPTKQARSKADVMREIQRLHTQRVHAAKTKLQAGEPLSDEEQEVLQKESLRVQHAAEALRRRATSQWPKAATTNGNASGVDDDAYVGVYDDVVNAELDVRERFEGFAGGLGNE